MGDEEAPVPVEPLVPELALEFPEVPEVPEMGTVAVEEDEPVELDGVGVETGAVSIFLPQADKDKATVSTTAETVAKPSRDSRAI